MVSQDFLKRWFGYTRRERTGTFILVLIVIIVTIARIRLLPGPVDEPVSSEGFSEAKNSDGYGSDLIPSDLVKPIEIRLKTFNPNTATAEELISLGLSERQSSTVINYREAGGVFSSPQDFRKIYGITPLQFDELIPYIIIPEVEKNFRGTTTIGKVTVKPDSKSVICEINSADSSRLVELKGIGPVLSGRIIKYRRLLGGFVSVSQLTEVYGIDSALVKSLSKYLAVDSSLVTRIDINSSGYGDLVRHPYISPEQANLIIRYRSRVGFFSSGGELVINKIVTHNDFVRLTPYLTGFKIPVQ